ncbi:3-isopropylmalate dehydrogenase [Pseudonocardia acaciae]|uniref:3-isopropylmalate dehydrogenase n=1 Tax=Pseudonocardia acaciae TaxID=551276 RepID=UPI00048A92DD|nr:3-isopropylmalate dehydrogenase [Pseudonocardia acaciae]
MSSSADYTIAVLGGDGIGPEVTSVAQAVLDAGLRAAGRTAEFVPGLLGGVAIDAVGTPLPAETVELCRRSDAALCGAVGGPKWDELPYAQRPGTGGLLPIRRDFGLFANVRPVRNLVPAGSPLGEVGFDFVVVRESAGGAYFTATRGQDVVQGQRHAYDLIEYRADEIERVVDFACRLARSRNKKVTSVDKANVLESSVLWRSVASEVFARYPDLEANHLYVDNASMQFVIDPGQFDVVVTENVFGDILSDIGAGLMGSLGLAPSATLNDERWGLYEPVHGTAPDIAGTGVANPIAAVLSAALLARHSLDEPRVAAAIERAVEAVVLAGDLPADLASDRAEVLSTEELGARLVGEIGGR